MIKNLGGGYFGSYWVNWTNNTFLTHNLTITTMIIIAIVIIIITIKK